MQRMDDSGIRCKPRYLRLGVRIKTATYCRNQWVAVLLGGIMEEWRDIQGYEGMYQVSNEGRVRSMDRTIRTSTGDRFYKGRIISGRVTNGYIYFDLYVMGKRKEARANRLVAEAFIPNPNNLPEVNHIDENPSNNKVENLEWVTHKQNMNHGTCQERRARKQSKRVQMISNGVVINEFCSMREAQRVTGIGCGNISHCCQGKRKYAEGYQWRLA